MNNSTVLTVSNLNKSFNGKKVLTDVNIEIGTGEIVGLLGSNGSGKTTLFKIINTLITDYSGEVRVCGSKLGVESKRNISSLPDINFMQLDWKVQRIVHLYNDFFDDFDKNKALEMLSSFGISKKEVLRTLSKGAIEKLYFSLIMCRKVKLYILDEPLSGVDTVARKIILDNIIANYCEDSSILLSTHLISEIEPIVDRVIIIDNGKIVIDSNIDDLKQDKGKSVDTIFKEGFKCI